jgi:hypothetical protein
VTSASTATVSALISSGVALSAGGFPDTLAFLTLSLSIAASRDKGNVPVLSMIDALVGHVDGGGEERCEMSAEARKLSEICLFCQHDLPSAFVC